MSEVKLHNFDSDYVAYGFVSVWQTFESDREKDRATNKLFFMYCR